MKSTHFIAILVVGTLAAGVVLLRRRLARSSIAPTPRLSYPFLARHVVIQIRELGLSAFKRPDTVLLLFHFILVALLFGCAFAIAIVAAIAGQ